MEIHYKSETKGYLDITFGPNWDYIALTRPYVENFLIVNMADKDNIHKIGMAASELLENATRFASSDGIRMIVHKNDKAGLISLSVFNYVTEQQAMNLLERVEDMNAGDPFEYYIFRMKESIKNKQETAGLGLARIRYEGEADIEVKYHSAWSTIEVRAVFRI